MKTEALKQALDRHGFDAAFGGARRDEEKSRAKERIFSFRSANHVWDPRNQRPELWRLFNTRINPGESVRVFPLSNWTELDVWQYIRAEGIAVVPLYFAAERPVVVRDGALIMRDDDRLPLAPGEQPAMRRVRFRTLGCYPLTGAVESDAATFADIIGEMRASRVSERQGRVIDADQSASMETQEAGRLFLMAVEPPRRPRSRRRRTLPARRLLRVLTCGSVDDGKSTLIGRLLHECGAVFEDQLAALETRLRGATARTGENIDFALLLDGLEAEREQGITIDVAYRYFATPTALLHRRRYAGARAIHPQHGDRRFERRCSRSS